MESAKELRFCNHAFAQCLIADRCIRYTSNDYIAAKDAFIAILPVVLRCIGLTVAGVMCQVAVITGILGGVSHPHIVCTHFRGHNELAYLPPVVVEEGLVASVDLFQTFFLILEIGIQILLSQYRLFEEVGTTTEAGCQSGCQSKTYYYLFHDRLLIKRLN